MKKLSFRALKSQDKTWDALIEDWRTQCSEFDEDIDQFAMTSLPVLGRLAAEPEANAAVFALLDDQEAHHAVVQLNRAMLPKTSGWTLRARHMILSPKYDYGAYSIDDYAIAIGSTVAETLNVAKSDLPADHVKFHLRSPADRSFFSTLSSHLSGTALFTDVRIIGAWLYLSLTKQ